MKNGMKLLAKSMLIICMTLGLGIEVNAQVLNSGQVVDEKKVWTIKFNNEVRFDDVTKNYIKVIDSRGIFQNVKLELEKDKKSIKVVPEDNGYKSGEKYTLKVMKGIKDENNKGLKKEVSMDFYIKDTLSIEALNTSINNIPNESLVVKDSDWIYYSDFSENNSIYRMKSDGSSKKVLYKGNSRICRMYLCNEYIYFVAHSGNYTQGEEYYVFKVKKDGVGKPQIVCKNISVNYQFQVDGNNLYYVEDSKLMKSDLLGQNPKKVFENIESNTDDIFFLLKDGWIYYYGYNYTSGKNTGVYKIKSDGSQKQCILKSAEAQSIKPTSINIDGDYIYYKNFSGTVYKSDLKGENLERVRFLNGISGMNIFNGYMYYLYEGAVHKIKTDGTKHDILAQKVLRDFDYINIVNGQLWYLDTNKELKKVDVVTKENGEGSKIENPISLEEGESFYVKGVNSPSSKIIKVETVDVNGDGKKENIILTGVNENYAYNNLKIFVQNTSNGEILGYDSLKNSSCEEIGNSIFFGDFNKDNVKDIKIDLLLNTQRGIHGTYIYTLNNNKLNKIFDESMISGTSQNFKYELLKDKNIKVYDEKGTNYLVNLASDDQEHYKYLTNIGVGPSLTVFYEGEDVDKDGSLELSKTIYLVGVSYSDFLCSVKTIYKFNNDTSKWEYKDIKVESEFFPCTKGKESGNDKNEKDKEKEKLAIQSLIESNNQIYYVEDNWTKNNENNYYLNNSYLRKVKNDLTTKTTIAQHVNGEIKISGEWMYYVNAYGVNLHRVKLDGSNDSVLGKDMIKKFCISGEYIYYCNNSGGIYKMKQDGSNIVMLSGDKCNEIAVFNDWIYYISANDKQLCKMKIDGTAKENLRIIAEEKLGASEDGVYYCVGENVYRTDLHGKNSKCIFQGASNKYAVYDGYVYCLNKSNCFIYKMKTDGSDLVKVSDEKVKEIVGVTGEFIYYKVGTTPDTHKVYRMKKTGGQPERVS